MPRKPNLITCMAVTCAALLLAADQPTMNQPASPPIPATGDQTIAYFSNEQAAGELAYEAALRDIVSPEQLSQYHDMTSSLPHIAGTPGDERLCDRLEATFKAMGLNVERQEIEVYLSYPVSASVSILQPEPLDLPITEKVLPEDPYTFNPDLTFGWNAYSGSGDVTAEVVYANYGTKADFQKLRELGVDCTGKIVIARYGGNFRGYKAKFAEQAGAAGLIIYTDPKDSGFTRGPGYPEGGFANETSVQRGSLLTLDYAGDPLTPFDPAETGVERLDAIDVALPTIPVQPIGWVAAQEIMSRMIGDAVPEAWAGTMPITYCLTGGAGLQVRLAVQQDRRLATTWNIVATLPGTDWPTERIIIGAHHDAWSFGAGDPNSGTIAVIEAARCFTNLAKQGQVPRRSVLFACWAAEEYGMVGSTEWVESREGMLTAGAVAYFNLDMASMGPNFGASASPTLKPVIIDATRYVPQPPVPPDGGAAGRSEEEADAPAGEPGDEPAQTPKDAPTGMIFERWLSQANAEGDAREPSIGDLGGGSDHVGFYCHLGIPSAGIGGSGSPGVSYHSNYDTLAWYRRFVGSDYASARMVTQVTAIAAARLANAHIIPLDPSRYAVDLSRHLAALSKRARDNGFVDAAQAAPALTDAAEAGTAAAPKPVNDQAAQEPAPTLPQFQPILDAARSFRSEADLLSGLLQSPAVVARQDELTLTRINRTLLVMERFWIDDEGLPGRPWFRSGWAATDEDSGYASWMLPMLRSAIEHKDFAAFDRAILWYTDVFYSMRNRIRSLRESLSL